MKWGSLPRHLQKCKSKKTATPEKDQLFEPIYDRRVSDAGLASNFFFKQM
ncbi:MAG: hypothetical protein ACI9CF_000792 [Candidatus Omnitrophota bacterium]|jgi:hypothetical protein